MSLQNATLKKELYHDYYIFKLLWQVTDRVFDAVITNIKKYNITFELVSSNLHSSYRDYFIQLFNSDRECLYYPDDMILDRWKTILDATNAPTTSLNKILRYFPQHVKYCSEIIMF